MRGENASRQQEQTPGNSGSFDSVNGLASDPIHYAQDDRVKNMEGKNQSIHYARDDSDKSRSEKSPDLEVFRAYIQAGARLAEVHVQYEKQADA